jgi:hypothetical protein
LEVPVAPRIPHNELFSQMSKRKHAEEAVGRTRHLEGSKKLKTEPATERATILNGGGEHANSETALVDSSQKENHGRKKQHRRDKDLERKLSSAWTVSEPIGGRLLDIDPVFSEDGLYVTIATLFRYTI